MATEIISVYVDDKTKTILQRLADDEHRSLSGQITFIIERFLEEKK